MQVQAVANRNDYRIQSQKFMGTFRSVGDTVSKVADTFEKSTEFPIFCTIMDIKNYLKNNYGRIEHGKIFNNPVTTDGDTLLMAFLHITPIKEEFKEYKELIDEMSKMTEINYDQKDSMGISALEWVMTTENPDVLKLMSGQKITQDPMLYCAYNNIKDPQFKKAFLEFNLYTLPIYKTSQEKETVIKSIINKKYPYLSPPGIDKEVLEKITNSFLNIFNNSDGEISGNTINIFKRIIEISEYSHLDILYKGLVLLKNEKGDIDIDKAAGFLAQYEKLGFYSGVKDIYKALISVVDYNVLEAKGIFDILNIPCEIKDGGIILKDNYISAPIAGGSLDPLIRYYEVDENKLLQHVTHIHGDLNLTNNNRVTSLPNLKYAWNICLDHSAVTNIPKLEKVHTLSLKDSLINCLPELRDVTELWINNSQIVSIPGIHMIQNSQGEGTKVINLPNIKKVSYLHT